MIVAVVLAAGESSRMGRPKAFLPFRGKTFIEAIVDALKRSGIPEIIVVLGHDAEAMKARIAHLRVTVLVNSEYKKGQLSSLQTAVRALAAREGGEKVEAMLVHLVDHPYLSAALVNRLIEGFRASGKSIALPRYGSRHGHPVIFSRSLFDELLEAPLEQGAKAVVKAHRDDTLEIETEEPGVAIDIDTPEEYKQHVKEP